MNASWGTFPLSIPFVETSTWSSFKIGCSMWGNPILIEWFGRPFPFLDLSFMKRSTSVSISNFDLPHNARKLGQPRFASKFSTMPCLVINSCERIHSSSLSPIPSHPLIATIYNFPFSGLFGEMVSLARSLALSLMHADTGLIATWGKRQRGNAMTHCSLSHVEYM